MTLLAAPLTVEVGIYRRARVVSNVWAASLAQPLCDILLGDRFAVASGCRRGEYLAANGGFPLAMTHRCQIVIPARLGSTRLAEKLLLRAGGKSILQHTFEAASRASVAGGVVVAVDDERLAEEVRSFGGRTLMTSPQCASGTDRIAEVARAMPEVELFVNVQGDEPEIDPATIDAVAAALIDDPTADMATVATPIRDLAVLEDPSCVKIVLAQSGRAVYFSRAVVPHCRDGVTSEVLMQEPPLYWHHIGLYAYRRGFLDWFASRPTSPLEQSERLEQLRAIEAGKQIVVARVARQPPGIDTREDFEAFQQRINEVS
jgi:3-deoxy-manno-octulosonate cytidylyltransferase (CMP-KDO synthetase)